VRRGDGVGPLGLRSSAPVRARTRTSPVTQSGGGGRVARVVLRLAVVVVALLLVGKGVSWGLSSAAQALSHSADGARQARMAAQQQQAQAVIAAMEAAHPSVDIGVGLINLNNGTRIDSGQRFEGASTTKLITAAAFLQEVEQGKQNLTEKIGAYPASFQLQQMVQQSNNDSWNTLVGQLGLDRLARYSQAIGVDYEVDGNLITAGSEASLLQKLYAGQLLTAGHRQLLLSYMTNTNNESLIPAASPAGAKVYHKYGQVGGNLHDAALIYHGKQRLALVIYTHGRSDGSQVTEQTQIIHQLTQQLLAAW
jgi:beta-lactamase class A